MMTNNTTMVSHQQLTSSVPSCSQAPLGQSCCCCKRCNMGGCDLKLDCGCCFHTRCFPSQPNKTWSVCPLCGTRVHALKLFPMTFDEIDQAQAQAKSMNASDKRGKKRKNATISRLDPSQVDALDLRTGRWTTEETVYCDKLIYYFDKGMLPIPDGHKLNDFLSSMLKSKQSRLTKKMKNAKLSTRQYKRTKGYIEKDDDARELSILETEFFASIRCNLERSEIRFHMQKEWREFFSNFCVRIGQTLDPNDWLHSVEELDRRASLQKDAARMERRKVMMGYALRQDSVNPPNGVFIDPKQTSGNSNALPTPKFDPDDDSDIRKKRLKVGQPRLLSPRYFSSPFVGKVVEYIQRHGAPFEHVDIWVPSFVSVPGESSADGEQKCRLCFAGCGTTETQIPTIGAAPVALTSEEQFDLLSFGEYSQKFSFEVGSGLPGRVYSSGVASWEQGIQNAPSGLFERKGGALQWGVQTVLGVPIPSPNVGRVVILFYSRFDRPKDQDMVKRISDELTKLMPSPKWKLVVDVGMPQQNSNNTTTHAEQLQEARVRELMVLIQTYMPENNSSPLAAFLPGFTSLRLLLLKRTRSELEKKLLKSALESFDNLKSTGRSDAETVAMVAREFMNLTRHSAAVGDQDGAASTSSSFPPLQQQQQQQQRQQQLHPQMPINGNALSAGLPAERKPAAPPAPPRTTWVAEPMLQGASSLAQPAPAPDLALASPSLQALAGQADILPLNMTAGQISAMLQNDALNNFRGN